MGMQRCRDAEMQQEGMKYTYILLRLEIGGGMGRWIGSLNVTNSL